MDLNSEKKINIIGMNYKDNFKNAQNFLRELGNFTGKGGIYRCSRG